MPKKQELKRNYTLQEDQRNELFDFLKAKFPEAMEDGAINFDTLQEVLADKATDSEAEEHFGLNWVGKRDARRMAMKAPEGTLAPCPGEGVNEDTTENIFIEGENLEVLKILRQSYKGKVKMIYIDPPYNTGKDFIYKDNFVEPLDDYLRKSGQKSEEGLLSSNPKSSGRFHTNWLNFLYPRIKLSNDLLSHDGVILVSIGKDEFAHLKVLMNETFGEENHIETFVWRTDGNIDNQAKIKTCHEYILMYEKNEGSFEFPLVVDPNLDENSKIFNDEIINTIIKNGPKNPQSNVSIPKGFPANFEKGVIKKEDVVFPQYNEDIVVSNYKLENDVVAYSGWSSKRLFQLFIENRFNPIVDNKNQSTKFILTENGAIESIKKRGKPSHVISHISNVGTTQSTSAYLEEYNLYFSYPKPVGLIKYLISFINSEEFYVMDFFAGSGTTAQSVLELNSVDNKKRKFICVQLDEKIDSNSKAGNAGFKSISQMTKKRISIASDGLKNSLTSKNTGFKVYKLTSSNFRKWRPVEQMLGDLTEQNTLFEQKPLIYGWKAEEVVTEIQLNEGFPLNSTIEKKGHTYCITSEDMPFKLYINLREKLDVNAINQLDIQAEDMFVCLDTALTDQSKLRMDDSVNLKTI